MRTTGGFYSIIGIRQKNGSANFFSNLTCRIWGTLTSSLNTSAIINIFIITTYHPRYFTSTILLLQIIRMDCKENVQ